jgi:hypothetical protein
MEIAGHKIPKWALIGGAGVVVAGGIYMYKRSSSSSSTASTTTAADTVTDPTTGDVYSATAVDPVSGLEYGAEIAEYGSVSAADSAVEAEQSAEETAAEDTESADTGTSDTGSTTPTTTGTTTTTTTAPTTTSTSTPTPTGTSAPATPAPSKTAPASYQFPAPSGLKVVSVGSTSVTISWNPVAAVSGHSPTGYTVAIYQTNGVRVYQQTWQGTSGTIGGLHASWTYHVNVWANGGTIAPPNSSVSFTTKS